MTRIINDESIDDSHAEFKKILDKFHEEVSISQDLKPTDDFEDELPLKSNIIRFDTKLRKQTGIKNNEKRNR